MFVANLIDKYFNKNKNLNRKEENISIIQKSKYTFPTNLLDVNGNGVMKDKEGNFPSTVLYEKTSAPEAAGNEDTFEVLFKELETKLIAKYKKNHLNNSEVHSFIKKYYPTLDKEIRQVLSKLNDTWLANPEGTSTLADFKAILYKCYELYIKGLNLYLATVNCNNWDFQKEE